MFENCTVKYKKDIIIDEVTSISVTYPAIDGVAQHFTVPINQENTDYQNILEWEKIDGNVIEEAD